MYSTVGQRAPICLRRRLLKICTTSFLASKSKRAMWTTSKCSRSVLYVSCASCAKSSGTGSGLENDVLDRSREIGEKGRKGRGARWLRKRTSIAIEHALDLLQVLADLFAGLGGEAIHISVVSMTAIERVGPHLFPRLTGRGRLEFEDVVSQAAYEIGRRALLCLEKVHGVTAGGGKKEDDRVRAERVEEKWG